MIFDDTHGGERPIGPRPRDSDFCQPFVESAGIGETSVVGPSLHS